MTKTTGVLPVVLMSLCIRKMDAPNAHGKLGSNVLFSDGSFKLVPPEEAEKIIARFSSIPKEINPEAQTEVKP